MSGQTLDVLKAAYDLARQRHEDAYQTSCWALLAEYRAELAWLRAGGSCIYQPALVRIRDLTKLVDEWSRILEKGEPADSVWPEHARARASP